MCYNYYMRMKYFTKQSYLCSINSEKPIELPLVKIELMSKTFLHCEAPHGDTH